MSSHKTYAVDVYYYLSTRALLWPDKIDKKVDLFKDFLYFQYLVPCSYLKCPAPLPLEL